MIQPLESRRCFTSTITLTTVGPEILLVGDATANHVEVTQEDGPAGDGTPSGGFRIAVHDSDTVFTVDGRVIDPRAQSYGLGPFDTTSPLATKPWRIELGGGADDIIFRRPAIRSLQLNLGRGNDTASVELDGTASLAVAGGDGDDRIHLGGLIGTVSVFGGAGRDRIDVTGDPDPYFPAEARTRITGKLQIADENGPTSVSMAYTDVRRNAAILTGNSIDHIDLKFCAFSNIIFLSTRGGSDVLSSQSSRFRQGTFVKSGSGEDELINLGEGLSGYA